MSALPLLLATRNAHKTREFAAILGREFSISDLTAKNKIPPIAETGITFAENAFLKALKVSRLTPELIVADDSGLEVTALGGTPGIYSARFAGENASDRENIEKLLSSLGLEKNRGAFFRCAIALCRDGEMLGIFDGEIEGTITLESRGENGFGYDPIFVPTGFNRTFAELGDRTKNRISHRARALMKLREYLKALKS